MTESSSNACEVGFRTLSRTMMFCSISLFLEVNQTSYEESVLYDKHQKYLQTVGILYFEVLYGDRKKPNGCIHFIDQHLYS